MITLHITAGVGIIIGAVGVLIGFFAAYGILSMIEDESKRR